MAFNKRKKAKIIFINMGELSYRIRTQYVHGIEVKLADSAGKEYQLFMQEEVKYVSGMRVNNPNVGVIVDGHFWKLTTFEGYVMKTKSLIDFLSQKDILDQHNKSFERIKGFKPIEEA